VHACTWFPWRQIVVIIVDVRYLYEDEDGKFFNLNGSQYGEVAYTLSYQNCTGEPFLAFVDAVSAQRYR
jgi:hypothetical protein